MARFQTNDKAEFPHLSDACDALDLGILHDIRESNDKPQPCYALGERPDRAAGLCGFIFTPYFDSLEELDEFCEKHANKIEEIATALESDGAYPSDDWWK